MEPRMAPICQCHSEGAWPTSTITNEIAPGPASIGTPSVTIPASSFAAASSASPRVSCVCERLACSMSRPISNRISPPAISKAGSVIPNSLKISCPATAKLVSTMKHVIAPLRAIRTNTKRWNRRKWIDQKKDGAQRQQRKAHDRRTADLGESYFGWVGPEHLLRLEHLALPRHHETAGEFVAHPPRPIDALFAEVPP